MAADLRSRLDKATRRPWRVTRGVVPSIDQAERVIVEAVHRSTEGGGYVVANCGPVGEYGSDNDAQLIVDAVNDLDGLLDRVDLLERCAQRVYDVLFANLDNMSRHNQDALRPAAMELLAALAGERAPSPQPIICRQCGKREVEEERRCYATPVCYRCLPPPKPLPIAKPKRA